MVARLGQDVVDVLVVGGGITGCGVALDAASRGLSVALVERDDFASGTSSKSSKLIHGGLRYLQQGDVRLVYEALRERQRLIRNAPHLVSVLPFLIPVLTGRPGLEEDREGAAVGALDVRPHRRPPDRQAAPQARRRVQPSPTAPRCRLIGCRPGSSTSTPRPTTPA
jgi:glycerol-3-phosphate dehydrogenase